MNNPSQLEINDILNRGYSVDIGQFIKRGWEICQSNLGPFIGFLLLTAVIGGALGLIPGVGSIASIIIGGPLNAGYLIVAYKIAKKQPTTFGDFFKGFQNAYFLPTFLATIVMTLLFLVCFMPAGVGIGILAATAEAGGEPNPALVIAVGVLSLLGLIAILYLSVAYMFAIPLIVGRRMSFWPAMEASRKLIGKQWFGFFGFVIVLGLLNMVGLLVCGLGLLVTAPLTSCSIAAAYESIVGLPTFDPSQA